MSNIHTWSTSATNNASASPDGFPEGMLPSGVNDSAREVMAAVKRWYVDAQWRIFDIAAVRQSNNSFLVSVTATDVFTAGRRLLMIDAGVTIAGDVLASSMSGANTLVTVSSSNLSASLSQVSVGIIDPLRRADPDNGVLTTTASVTASDYLEVWQSGTGVRRKALQTNVVRGAGLVLSTEQDTSTGATSYDFTSIPSWVKRITIMPVAVSTNGTSHILIQIGDSGGVESAGYTALGIRHTGAAGSGTSSTAGFLVNITGGVATYSGSIVLTLENATNFTWTCASVVTDTSNIYITSGSKSLSAALDRVRITTVNGTDTFDAGAISILYEG